MGRDMYLSATKYLSGHPSNNENAKSFAAILEAIGMDDTHSRRCGSFFLTVSLTVAYWHDANLIYQWFVEQCQGGKDDYQHYLVERGQLQSLVDLCRLMIKTLETDKYSLREFQDTIDMLEPVLADERLIDWEFDFRSLL